MSIKYSWLDHALIAIDTGMRSLLAPPVAQRPNPARNVPEDKMNTAEQKKSSALMRINHTGEVCAQALYFGQALVAKSPQTKNALLKSAHEEEDHLAWCSERLNELQGHTSYLNPLWYFGSFSIGLLAGVINDKWSLGFVVETERQVEKHLREHLTQLPLQDVKSRKILQQMCEEEAHHATVAMSAGAIELPFFVKKIMMAMSKVMTTTAYYL